MNKRLIEFVVGSFMLLGIVASVFIALKVSGLSLDEVGEDHYTLHAWFDNASGLKVRSSVSIAGVNVGEVTDIVLDHDEYQAKVTFTVRKEVDYIPDDSIASINTAGLLGEKYISISLGGSHEVVKPGGAIYDTQSSLVLEELIGEFLMNMANE